ncbi:MAG: type II toxin-antitoxin system RelE/ParE family toxin [Desulfovibrionaceae bacterium]|nr:type II toxin-antitoxin system RelE/ParE family toxin [Desulfovibrionaceae bacterium]MBF0515060.1 type II toxin-antitoxin system RelE/ParE family toxin [Desulfovibrionaceae bacterium]
MEPKELVWIGSSRKDLKAFPAPVRRCFGLSLFAAQLGEWPPDAKPLKDFGGSGVMEIIQDHRGDTYRAVYTVRFAAKVYVLHAFQKKSKSGIATPQHEIELIRTRLKWAQRLYAGKGRED